MTIFGKSLPKEWLEALYRIQQTFPEAILAGGCLRDLVLGGEVKDLDVFVPYDPMRLGILDATLLDDAPAWSPCIATTIFATYVETMRDEVGTVLGYVVPDLNLPLQVIALNHFSHWSALERMDFAACRIGHNGYTHFAPGEAFADLANRRITLTEPRDATQAARSLRRADRFRAKYAGTDVVVDTSAAAKFEGMQ